MAPSKPGRASATAALIRNHATEEKPSLCSDAAVSAIRPVSAKLLE
jgi:hypothetical protein